MRKLLPLLLVFALAFAACGGDDDDDDAASIEDAETCEDVGDVFIGEMQTLLDELSDVGVDEISGGEPPEALADFETSINEISSKSEELGCSDEEIAEIVTDRVDELEADGPVPELLLEEFRNSVESGEVFE